MGTRLRQAQTNFTAGAIAPTLAARSDVAAYANAAETLKNFIILWSGGAKTRPGTKYLASLTGSAVRLAPFVFDEDEIYCISFSNGRADVYDTDGNLVHSLTSAPWTTAMLPQLNWTQYGDTMFVCHEDLPTQVITRTAADTFTRAAFAFEENSAGQPKYQPYYKYAPSAMTLTPAATTGTGVNMTTSADYWTDDHVGVIIRYKGKEILITSKTSATVAVGTIRETLSGTTADADWDEQTFSAVYGYPRSVTFFNDRLVFAGAKSRRSGIWLSKVGAYYNFDLGAADPADAIWENWPGDRVQDVRHCVGAENLLIFSDAAFAYVPASESAGLTPENFRIREQQPFGSGWARPAPFDEAALFIQNTGGAVREAYWEDTRQRYTGQAVNLLATHLISDPGELDVIYGTQSQPEAYAYAVNDDGSIAFFISYRAEKIAGWTQWTTEGDFKSIAVANDQVFIAANRALTGGDTICLELVSPTLAALDCSQKVTSGSATRTFSGFTHLASLEVNVVTNEHSLGTYTVSAGGVITLDDLDPAVTEIEAGFAFDQQITPMPVDFELPDGRVRGLYKRAVRALLLLDRSAAFSVQGRDVLLDFQGDDFANPPSTKTGVVEVRLLGIDREAQFNVLVADPVKVTVLGITREVEING